VLAGVNQAAYAGQVAYFKLVDLVPDSANAAHDFVARHHGEDTGKPLVFNLMQVRVTHAAKGDVKLHIVRAHFPVLEGPGGEVSFGALGSVGFGWNHKTKGSGYRELDTKSYPPA
jgi:hypothetical protein